MVRLTVTLIVAIYIIMLVIPGSDHAPSSQPDRSAQVDVTRSFGQNWLVALITDAEASAREPRRASPSTRAVQADPLARLITTADGFALRTAQGEQIAIDAVIDPAALWAATMGGQSIASVSLATPAEIDAPSTALVAEGTPAAAAPLWRVSGESVNFRAGPSTQTAVLTALTRGEEVLLLAAAADDWAHLRVVGTGLEGYMAARFLEPVN